MWLKFIVDISYKRFKVDRSRPKWTKLTNVDLNITLKHNNNKCYISTFKYYIDENGKI